MLGSTINPKTNPEACRTENIMLPKFFYMAAESDLYSELVL